MTESADSVNGEREDYDQEIRYISAYCLRARIVRD